MVARADLTGQVFNRLTVVDRNPNREAWSFWNCLCTCGNSIVVAGGNLKRGNVKSCGCFRSEKATEKLSALNSKKGADHHNFKHGLHSSPEYNIWNAMWDRTTNPRNPAYEKYKGRRPPDEWKDFQTFYRDMGPRPSPELTLERIRNEEPYGPTNCKWATRAEQSRNQSTNVWLDVGGERMIQTDAAKRLGMSDAKLHTLLKTKTIEQILKEH